MRNLILLCLLALIAVLSASAKESPAPIKVDFIVVGGGGAGSVIASLLSNTSQRYSVLVLERGNSDDPRLDQGIDALIPNADWTDQPYFFPIPQDYAVGPPGRQPHFASQYATGGSTRIFGCVNNRPSAEWVEAHLGPEYNYSGVMLPNFKANEDHYCYYRSANETGISAADCAKYHGKGGPMKIAFPSLQHISQPIKDLLQTAAAEGVGFTTDYNNPTKRAGFAWEQHFRNLEDPSNPTSPRSRVSTWTGWLPPSFRAARWNLVIKTNVLVDKFIISNDNKKEIRGVRYQSNGETYFALARKQVFLSAGVIHTPQLLQLNGIGPQDLLNSLGIPVVANNPAVGQNFHVHQGMFNAYRLNQDLGNNKLYHGVGVAAAHLKSSFTNLPADIQLEILEGVYAETSAGFETGPAFPIVTRAGTHPPVNPANPGVVSFPFLGVVIINDEPASKGSVNITTRAIYDRPQLNYGWTGASIFGTGDDAKLSEAYERVHSFIMGNNAFNSTYQPVEVYPGNRFDALVQQEFNATGQLPEAQFKFLTKMFYRMYSIQPFYHATSTCALGKCTDMNGRVKGVDGLTVCDNSLLPVHPDANPTTAMMGLCTEVVKRTLARVANVNFDIDSTALEY